MSKQIGQLRFWTDQIIDIKRGMCGLPAMANPVNPSEIDLEKKRSELDGLICDDQSIKAELKSNLFKLANDKATKLFDITEMFDQLGDSVATIKLWGMIQNLFKNLKHFFLDFKNKEVEQIQVFSEQLIKVITECRTRFGLNNINLKELREGLTEIPEALDILKKANFHPSPEHDKQDKLATVVCDINLVSKAHSKRHLTESKSLVKDVIDLSRIEAELHNCIKKLSR